MKILADAQERNTIQQGMISLVLNLVRSSNFEHQSPVELGKGLDTAQRTPVWNLPVHAGVLRKFPCGPSARHACDT